MSKLLDWLEKINRGGTTGGIGFGMVAPREDVPVMALLGVVSSHDPTEARAANKVGLAGALIESDSQQTGPSKQVLEALGKLPWGVQLKKPSNKSVARLRKQGCDFFIFETGDTPADVLEEGDAARILTIDLSMKPELANTIEDLPVDMVILNSPTPDDPLMVTNLMAISLIRNQMNKFCILRGTRPWSTQELQSLRDIGIDCIALNVSRFEPGEMEQFKVTLDKLSRRKSRPEKSSAIVPSSIGAGLRSTVKREEEEEEGEEEDY
jgi:hypothetical protein